MAPQTSIPIAANVLGTIGTVFVVPMPLSRLELTVSAIAFGAFRIYANWRRKNTDGLPGSMLFLWASCCVPFGTYAIAQNFNIPLQIQPQICCLLSIISWTQTLIYHSCWPTWKAVSLAIAMGLLYAGIEVALVMTLRPLYDRGISYPMTVIGIIASVLLAGGLLPPYYEIWKRRGRVTGINWIFLLMDWLGALFSLMAIVAQNTFDVLGGVLYIACILLEGGIAACHLVWLIRSRAVRYQAKEQGTTFDEFVEACAPSDPGFAFQERVFRIRGLDNRIEQGDAFRGVQENV